MLYVAQMCVFTFGWATIQIINGLITKFVWYYFKWVIILSHTHGTPNHMTVVNGTKFL